MNPICRGSYYEGTKCGREMSHPEGWEPNQHYCYVCQVISWPCKRCGEIFQTDERKPFVSCHKCLVAKLREAGVNVIDGSEAAA